MTVLGKWQFYVTYAQLDAVGFFMFVSMNDFLPGCLFDVVIQCFMIGVNA